MSPTGSSFYLLFDLDERPLKKICKVAGDLTDTCKVKSAGFPSGGYGFSVKFQQHFCHALIGVGVACAESHCVSLNSLQLLNTLLVVGIPCSTAIFEGWSD